MKHGRAGGTKLFTIDLNCFFFFYQLLLLPFLNRTVTLESLFISEDPLDVHETRKLES